MRLLCTFNDQKKGSALSDYLLKEGIDNQLEIIANTDWGSSGYGDTTARVWVTEEDDLEKATRILHEFEQDPADPRFHRKEKIIPAILEPIQHLKEAPLLLKKGIEPLAVQPPMGMLTLYLILTCTLFLFIGTLTSPAFEEIPANIPQSIVFNSSFYKALMFDYPKAYEWIDQFVNTYGIQELHNLKNVPAEGQNLLKHFSETPYWKGFYQLLLDHFHNRNLPWNFNAPLFEKIRQGEIWRLFSPCLLHYDIFHLFFNMIWLLVLGRQMENKLGIGRYLLFILFTGIFSNIAQYLMGGANFLGFSGVLCAMLTFMWMRQRKAAWEGYQLQSSTFGFMAIFILAMFAIQVGSFIIEIYTNTSITPGIANTAHLAGGSLGFLLGSLSFFQLKITKL